MPAESGLPSDSESSSTSAFSTSMKVTYPQIQASVKETAGFVPKTDWIAHVKELNGLRLKRRQFASAAMNVTQRGFEAWLLYQLPSLTSSDRRSCSGCWGFLFCTV